MLRLVVSGKKGSAAKTIIESKRPGLLYRNFCVIRNKGREGFEYIMIVRLSSNEMFRIIHTCVYQNRNSSKVI